MQQLRVDEADPWIVTALPTRKVLLRPLHVQLSKASEIDKVLAFQAEPLLPYPIEEAVLDRYILGSGPDGADLCIAAVREDDLSSHLQFYQDSGIEPESSSCAPAGLATFGSLFCPEEDELLIIHTEDLFATCVLARAGVPLAAHHVEFGLDSSDDAILKKLTLTAHSLYKVSKGDNGKPPLLVTGSSSAEPGFARQLAKQLDCELAESSAQPETQAHAAVVGLAMSVLQDKAPRLNLRKGSHSYPRPWRRFTTALGTYFGACLLVALALFAYTAARSSTQDQQLRQEYLNVIGALNLSPEQAEEQFRGRPAGESFDPAKLSRDDLRRRLDYLERNLGRPQVLYPLQPATPLVSDLAAWLGQFAAEGEGIRIESLAYTMVKHPEPRHPKERYQVRVDLDFMASPEVAKRFHDALMAPTSILQGNTDIKWSSSGGKYRTSFFLQDRTLY